MHPCLCLEHFFFIFGKEVVGGIPLEYLFIFQNKHFL